MRTTLSFDDHLFREAKELVARDGETLTLLDERAVRQYLHDRPATSAAARRGVPGRDASAALFL